MSDFDKKERPVRNGWYEKDYSKLETIFAAAVERSHQRKIIYYASDRLYSEKSRKKLAQQSYKEVAWAEPLETEDIHTEIIDLIKHTVVKGTEPEEPAREAEIKETEISLLETEPKEPEILTEEPAYEEEAELPLLQDVLNESEEEVQEKDESQLFIERYYTLRNQFLEKNQPQEEEKEELEELEEIKPFEEETKELTDLLEEPPQIEDFIEEETLPEKTVPEEVLPELEELLEKEPEEEFIEEPEELLKPEEETEIIEPDEVSELMNLLEQEPEEEVLEETIEPVEEAPEEETVEIFKEEPVEEEKKEKTISDELQDEIEKAYTPTSLAEARKEYRSSLLIFGLSVVLYLLFTFVFYVDFRGYDYIGFVLVLIGIFVAWDLKIKHLLILCPVLMVVLIGCMVVFSYQSGTPIGFIHYFWFLLIPLCMSTSYAFMTSRKAYKAYEKEDSKKTTYTLTVREEESKQLDLDIFEDDDQEVIEITEEPDKEAKLKDHLENQFINAISDNDK